MSTNKDCCCGGVTSKQLFLSLEFVNIFTSDGG